MRASRATATAAAATRRAVPRRAPPRRRAPRTISPVETAPKIPPSAPAAASGSSPSQIPSAKPMMAASPIATSRPERVPPSTPARRIPRRGQGPGQRRSSRHQPSGGQCTREVWAARRPGQTRYAGRLLAAGSRSVPFSSQEPIGAVFRTVVGTEQGGEMRKVATFAALVMLGALALGTVAFAHGDDRGGGKTGLNGYEEVVGGPGPSTGSVSTEARGTFNFQVRDDPLRIHYVLKYKGMEGTTVSQAHIHFAQRHVGGGVIAFLCGGGKPACTSPDGRFEGDIVAADVLGPADQGIQPGALTEVIRAIRAGAVYANVHSTPQYPEGEIRGQLPGGKHGKEDNDRKH